MSPDDHDKRIAEKQRHKDAVNFTMRAQKIAQQLGCDDNDIHGDESYWLSKIRQQVPIILKHRKEVKKQKKIILLMKVIIAILIGINILQFIQ